MSIYTSRTNYVLNHGNIETKILKNQNNLETSFWPPPSQSIPI